MAEQKHTPEPIKVAPGKRGVFGRPETMKPIIFVQTDFHAVGKITNGPEATICEMVVGERATDVAGHFDHRITLEEAEATAARMVTTYNACAGIPSEALNGGGLAVLRDAIRDVLVLRFEVDIDDLTLLRAAFAQLWPDQE